MTDDFLYWGILYFKFAVAATIVNALIDVMLGFAKFIKEANE